MVNISIWIYFLVFVFVKFQRKIDKTFYSIFNESLITFVNNFLFFTNSIKQKHAVSGYKILNNQLKYNIYGVIEKSYFSVSELSDLEYILLGKVIWIDSNYTKIVQH